MKTYDEDVQKLLRQVYDSIQNEDVSVRERQIRRWRRLKLLWEGFLRTWYSETAHDWRIWDEEMEQDTDQAYYDKPVNVFRAYLESIIAALSVTVPPIKCYPDDADNTLDLATAKAGDKIAQLIYRHNDVGLLWLHALFIFCTEGMVAFYNYPHSSEEYGTYEEKDYEEVEVEKDQIICPNCGTLLVDKELTPEEAAIPLGGIPNPQQTAVNPDIEVPDNRSQEQLENDERDEFDPGNDDAELHALMNNGTDLCPACMKEFDPELKRGKFVVTRLTGVTTKPKTRICMEAFGGLYVKVGNYARNQKDAPYLVYSHEMDYAMACEEYKHLRGNKELLKQIKVNSGSVGGNSGGYNLYDQWGRLSPQYQGEYPINVVTKNEAWIRPGKFNVLNDEEDIKKLQKLFPDGVKVVYVNDQYAEACNESLDDHWTLTENPMSDYLYFDPLGQSLVSVQEITSDLISLVLQTIEHGIGQTFADPAVLNFNAYQQTETLPGGVFPATPKSGKTLDDGFHELKTATLSSEVLPFSQQIQTYGQLASGATPSIFGGQITGVGGETASGYSMSRAQALQRLQNTWKLFTTTWKRVFSKVVPQYIKEVQEDERDVQQDDDGNFINVFIRKADLEGKIGKVELEANENLPMTWSQKKDLVMNLLTASNPEVLAILNAPENVGLLHEALGLVDFYVPGEDDIIKQYDEIKLLLNSEPIQQPPPPELMQQAVESGMEMPPMQEVASVPVDPDYDNHQVEFEIVRKWVISEAGRQTKTENEAGYRNVLLHGREHLALIRQAAMNQQLMEQQQGNKPNDKEGKGATPSKKPNPKKQEASIQGEQNVRVTA